MKKYIIILALVLLNFNSIAQSLSINKVIRLNIHFMLRANGTGNFTETSDGDGRSWYNGYVYANELINRMNERNNWNDLMNIPIGNTTPVLTKNFHYVLDGVYFIRNDSTFDYGKGYSYYISNGVNKNNVMNIILNYCPTNDDKCSSSGRSASLDNNSKFKCTENRSYWQNYVLQRNSSNPFGWYIDAVAINTNHELGHLLGLKHTVQLCKSCVNDFCDDDCFDTPTAWDIMAANNCSKHPACGWNQNNTPDCSNNIMDYTNGNALTPCQITKIHTGLEGGMKTYLVCDAVSYDLTLNDIGYPKLAYFGKDVIIGNTTSLATVTNEEKIKLYFSSKVELNNFEIRADSEFEVIQEAVCSF
jgi:hypothetical protein